MNNEEYQKMVREHWSYQLVRELADEKLHLDSTQLSVAIRDLFPKARFHYLVLPKKEIDTLHELTIQDIDLLKDMYDLGLRVIRKNGLNPSHFKFGYHLAPHMKRLHLHVISTDFHSRSLKRRHHWTIFNSDLFMTHDAVLKELALHGVIQPRPMDYIRALREGPLTCHRCAFTTSLTEQWNKDLYCLQ
ncbi:aprataxin [Anopheles nili]|uniref:aprataxin n=1 Tax=Anopheles nili TaxID=185578 RepID=UPI00237A606C|nr:aprataxin [Anopheles nili]